MDHRKNNRIVVVDPSEADLPLQLIKSKGYILEAVLLTHKHQDHIGGVRKLAFFHHQAAVGSGLLRQCQKDIAHLITIFCHGF
ncbi:MBL fold metallo-hydrolase [Peptoniphilus asaccharolyticus]|nr:MBL fold metallo-hydrolase [Peptoniphilus asaccharolyticus]